MTARQTLDDWLRRFSARTGLAALSLNEQGICVFDYAGLVEIAVELPDEAGGHLYLVGTLFSLADRSPAACADLYEQMLRVNAFSPVTRGACLALHGPSPHVVLCYHYPMAALDEVSFHNLLTQFTQTAHALHGQLNRPSDDGIAPPSEHRQDTAPTGDGLPISLQLKA